MRWILVLFGCWIVAWSGCRNADDPNREIEQVHSEIRDSFAAFKKASEENDYATMFDHLSRESVKRMIFDAIVTMGTTAKNKESEQILTTYINQEKLDQIGNAIKDPSREQVMELYMVCIDRPREMFVESFKLLQKLNPDRKNPRFGDLKDIKVSGNVASAKTEVTTYSVKPDPTDAKKQVESSEQKKITVYFVRGEDRWLYATKDEWAGVIQ